MTNEDTTKHVEDRNLKKDVAGGQVAPVTLTDNTVESITGGLGRSFTEHALLRHIEPG